MARLLIGLDERGMHRLRFGAIRKWYSRIGRARWTLLTRNPVWKSLTLGNVTQDSLESIFGDAMNFSAAVGVDFPEKLDAAFAVLVDIIP